MAIISVALSDSLLLELDKVVKDGGFASRSEAIRASLKGFISKRRWLSNLEGPFLATLMFTYVKGKVKGDALEVIRHEFEDVIATEVHMHLEEDNCLEVLVIKGVGERIRKLADELTKLKGVSQVEMMVMPLRSRARLE